MKKRVESRKVTPALAQTWLKTNRDNRPVRQSMVDAMALDMKNDEWDDNGETIKFDEDNDLIDGQHRLLAVVLSGCSVEMTIVWGIKRKFADTIDAGTKRTFADQLHKRKEKNHLILAAIVRKVYLWEDGLTLGRRKSTSNYALFRTLEKYPELRKIANDAGNVAGRSALVASVAGYCMWIFNSIDSEDSKYFFDRLGDLHNSAKGNPIDALKNRLQRIKNRDHEHISDIWLTAVTIKAWNKYRTGETWDQVDFRPGGVNPERVPFPHGWSKNRPTSMDPEETDS